MKVETDSGTLVLPDGLTVIQRDDWPCPKCGKDIMAEPTVSMMPEVGCGRCVPNILELMLASCGTQGPTS